MKNYRQSKTNLPRQSAATNAPIYFTYDSQNDPRVVRKVDRGVSSSAAEREVSFRLAVVFHVLSNCATIIGTFT